MGKEEANARKNDFFGKKDSGLLPPRWTKCITAWRLAKMAGKNKQSLKDPSQWFLQNPSKILNPRAKRLPSLCIRGRKNCYSAVSWLDVSADIRHTLRVDARSARSAASCPPSRRCRAGRGGASTASAYETRVVRERGCSDLISRRKDSIGLCREAEVLLVGSARQSTVCPITIASRARYGSSWRPAA